MSAPAVKGMRSMSFLSPKRRKTTGNLKANGQQVNGNGNGSSDAPATPPALGSPIEERPPPVQRYASHPVVPSASNGRVNSSTGLGVGEGGGGGDGNLFYAYARKDNDLQSRYLLTFASASVANEWWHHVRANFPSTTRPGAQLFSFTTDDLLSKAWRHPSFAHLKSKWMYISFSEASDGIGGAAQGIIPVQDVEGNMLGGGAPASPTSEGREMKRVKGEVVRLEEHFERMMKAVERNTEKVVELAGARHERSGSDVVSFTVDGEAGNGKEGTVDMGVLSGHFVRMNDLLSRNMQHVEELTRKHFESENRLKEAIEALDKRQKDDGLDMQRLETHLVRVQALMENSAKERKDSALEVQQQSQPLQVDFSPLTERLGKVQEAVEQNSELIKALLNEGDEKVSTPFWGRDAPAGPDLNPLTQHLERINSAIEQQSEHVKALVGYASGENGGHGEESTTQAATGLMPLGEHLEQIYNAIEEGNSHTREWQKQLQKQPQETNLDSLSEHLKALRDNSQQSNEHMQQLIESQDGIREAVEANGGEIDFTPLADLLDAIRESTDSNAVVVQKLLESQEATRHESAIDFGPLKEHLEAIRIASDKNAEQVRTLVSTPPSNIDLSPLTDRLNSIHSTLQKQKSPEPQGTGDARFLLNALTSHLSKIQAVTESNATSVKALREKQSSSGDKMHIAVSETSEQVRSLMQRNKENESRIEAQNAQMRELMSGQREMVEVLREVSRSVVASGKGCEHVVVPPPRKMGRKVVGFVYDAKDGGS
ncbi:uncharacterized protein LTR77_008803 [Saxophila tyrrhenica]|uniref:Uncharacterized protein n=1 Tax=Saxophila tyrrhenica TaxID=1690608 RepID=A0AAV9P078_9PEZI|nr:hypothetical protein LTR77_008803 [Saxophila tyrrhenica]